jgi:hypothetical protein
MFRHGHFQQHIQDHCCKLMTDQSRPPLRVQRCSCLKSSVTLVALDPIDTLGIPACEIAIGNAFRTIAFTSGSKSEEHDSASKAFRTAPPGIVLDHVAQDHLEWTGKVNPVALVASGGLRRTQVGQAPLAAFEVIDLGYTRDRLHQIRPAPVARR